MSKLRILSQIILLSIAVSIGFGIMHDIFSVSVYEPWLRDYHAHTGLRGIPLALYWGFMATWWVGAIGGIVLGVCATVGGRPVITWRRLAKPLLVGASILLVVAFLSWGGMAVFAQQAREEIVAKHGQAEFDQRWRGVATASMHGISYLGSVVLVVVLSFWTAIERVKSGRNT